MAEWHVNILKRQTSSQTWAFVVGGIQACIVKVVFFIEHVAAHQRHTTLVLPRRIRETF